VYNYVDKYNTKSTNTIEQYFCNIIQWRKVDNQKLVNKNATARSADHNRKHTALI
jgi:hypothetical protein